MRLASFIAIAISCLVAGCAVDADPGAPVSVEAANEGSTEQVVVTRTRLEQGFDTLLRANGGSCDIDQDRQVCVTTTVGGLRRPLRVGDPIPSASTLSLCVAGGACFPVPPPPPAIKCHHLVPCTAVLVGCIVHGELQCHPSDGDLECSCVD